MRLSYDPRHNIAYLRLRERPGEVQTVQIGDDVNVDVGPDGQVCGIESLDANHQLRLEDGGRLVVVNEALGREVELSLPVGDAA
ncbi:MAG: DUF2283 domain-containing protein [Armatimonadetes bacterium]|nr:DUF2283 domain-containing protein [Armatimonadota bacterium]